VDNLLKKTVKIVNNGSEIGYNNMEEKLYLFSRGNQQRCQQFVLPDLPLDSPG